MKQTYRQSSVRPSHYNGRGGRRDDTPKERLTYAQFWPSYRLAQKYEGEFVRQFISDLMDLVVAPPHKFGRRPNLLSDMLKAMALKVYSRMSAGRSQTFIRDAWRLGYLEDVPSANSVIEYFNMPELTPLILECIEFTASVFQPIEHHFAMDGSGFRTTSYDRWLEDRWGGSRTRGDESEKGTVIEKKRREWRKVQMIVGTATQVIVAVKVDSYTSSEYKHFEPMFNRVVGLFDVIGIYADGAFTGRSNYEAAERWGATAYLPFHDNHVRPSPLDHSTWAVAYRLYADYYEEFKREYGKRNMSESAYSRIKRLFGETVRSKNLVPQVNEILLKALCMNMVVLNQHMFEFNTFPFFVADPRFINSLHEKNDKRLLAILQEFHHQTLEVDYTNFKHFDRPGPRGYTNGVNGHHRLELPDNTLETGW